MANELRAPRAPCDAGTPPSTAPPSESPPSLPLRELTGAFVEENTPRFLMFAGLLMGRYGSHIPPNKEPHDYVVDAYVSLWSGRRRRPAHVPLKTCIYKIIAALIFRDLGRLENRIPHDRIDTLPGNDENPSTLDVVDSLPSAEDVLIANDLVDELTSDSKYRAYIELRQSGRYKTAAEYAKALGVREKDIRVMNKYLQRRRDQWKGAVRPPAKRQPK